MTSLMDSLHSKPLTTHFGGSCWLDDSRRGSSSLPPPPPAPSPPPSFAQAPNPSRSSSTSIVSPVRPSHLVATLAVVAASVAIYRLYERWKRQPQHASLRRRKRLTDAFTAVSKGDRDREARADPQRHSWLWRLFFAEEEEKRVSKPSRSRRSRGSVRSGSARSPSPRSTSPSPPSASFLSCLFASSTASHPSSRQPSLSHVSSLSSSSAYRTFMLEVHALAEAGVLISSPPDFFLKRERMRESIMAAMRDSESGCEANLHILSTFDRTLTTLTEAPACTHGHSSSGSPPPPPALCLTSQSLLECFLPPAYTTASRHLFHQYFGVEMNPHLSPEAKDAFMREWWVKTHALLTLDENKLNRASIRRMVRTTLDEGRMRLRDGVDSLLVNPATEEEASRLGPLDALCARFGVPVLIFSGAVHDVIEEVLLYHGVRVHNTNRGDLDMDDEERQRCADSYVHLLANPMRWGAHKGSAQRSASTHGSPASASVPLPSRLHSAFHASSLSGPTIGGSSASVCLGFDHRFLVHSLNKTYARVLEQPALLRRVAYKPHVLLLGHTLQDAEMTNGMERKADSVAHMERQEADMHMQPEHTAHAELPHLKLDAEAAHTHLPPHPPACASSSPASSLLGDVLRVGFLNDPSCPPTKLAAFQRAYDVVCINSADRDISFVQRTLAYLCGSSEGDISSHYAEGSTGNTVEQRCEQHTSITGHAPHSADAGDGFSGLAQSRAYACELLPKIYTCARYLELAIELTTNELIL